MPRNSSSVPAVWPRTAPSSVETIGAPPEPEAVVAVPALAAVVPAAARVSAASAAQQAAASRAGRQCVGCRIISAPSVRGRRFRVASRPGSRTGEVTGRHACRTTRGPPVGNQGSAVRPRFLRLFAPWGHQEEAAGGEDPHGRLARFAHVERNGLGADHCGGATALAAEDRVLPLSFCAGVEATVSRLATTGLGGPARRVIQPATTGPVIMAAVRDPHDVTPPAAGHSQEAPLARSLPRFARPLTGGLRSGQGNGALSRAGAGGHEPDM